MKNKIYKVFPIERKTVDAEKGIYEAWVSTEDVDRDGDILLADGADTGNYMRNPLVLFGHKYGDAAAVVAKTLEIAVTAGKGIKLTFQFLKRGLSATADLVHDLWKEEFLNAMSVGFIPEKWEKRTNEEGEELERGFLFPKWEMLEGSIVTIPSNQDALRAAFGDKLFNEYNGEGVDDPDPDIEPEPEKPEPEKPDDDNSEEPNNDDPPHDDDAELEEIADDLLETAEELLEVLQ